jgi:molecular chaperone DnaK
VRNSAEQLVYSIEKLIKDNEDKLPADVKDEVQGDVDSLKSALAGDNDDLVKDAFDKLSQSQTKLGQAIYSQSQANEQASTAGATDAPSGSASGSDDDIVDAEVVDEEDSRR